ncbi:MAG: tRNA (guanosine(37)-N1)-methyltransferase TrmD [Patescibacteria group bacterium]
MKIDILTLFPDMFSGPFQESIVKRAVENKQLELSVHNLRNWTTDNYKTVDDHPYGGGPGMVMRVDIIDKAVTDLKEQNPQLKPTIILMDTKGQIYTQKKAVEVAQKEYVILIAGHYEGIDHRVHEHVADEVISIGQYVLTGGEIPAMVVVDSVSRLLPGVINPDSLTEESYSPSENTVQVNLEYPQYTRPQEYKGWKVPEILLSGNHHEIEKWRQEKTKELA